jgi:hypothetical protein
MLSKVVCATVMAFLCTYPAGTSAESRLREVPSTRAKDEVRMLVSSVGTISARCMNMHDARTGRPVKGTGFIANAPFATIGDKLIICSLASLSCMPATVVVGPHNSQDTCVSDAVIKKLGRVFPFVAVVVTQVSVTKSVNRYQLDPYEVEPALPGDHKSAISM